MFDLAQGSLFGVGEIAFDPAFTTMQRVDLDATAWIDYAPMWLAGDEELYRILTERVAWTQPRVRMYDNDVITPRLVGRVESSIDPVVAAMSDSLSDRYRVRLDRISAGWYRDGRDSVAFHGDRVARERREAIVATVSLGSPRRFLIKPKGGGRARSFSLGHGDLVVMGGSCQRTWEHGVPKVASAEGRIALMFRHVYD